MLKVNSCFLGEGLGHKVFSGSLSELLEGEAYGVFLVSGKKLRPRFDRAAESHKDHRDSGTYCDWNWSTHWDKRLKE